MISLTETIIIIHALHRKTERRLVGNEYLRLPRVCFLFPPASHTSTTPMSDRLVLIHFPSIGVAPLEWNHLNEYPIMLPVAISIHLQSMIT